MPHEFEWKQIIFEKNNNNFLFTFLTEQPLERQRTRSLRNEAELNSWRWSLVMYVDHDCYENNWRGNEEIQWDFVYQIAFNKWLIHSIWIAAFWYTNFQLSMQWFWYMFPVKNVIHSVDYTHPLHLSRKRNKNQRVRLSVKMARWSKYSFDSCAFTCVRACLGYVEKHFVCDFKSRLTHSKTGFSALNTSESMREKNVRLRCDKLINFPGLDAFRHRTRQRKLNPFIIRINAFEFAHFVPCRRSFVYQLWMFSSGFFFLLGALNEGRQKESFFTTSWRCNWQ